MKICILTTSYPLNPNHFAGNFIRNSALALSRRGHSVKVIAPDDISANRMENDCGIEVHRFKYFPVRKLQCLAYGNGILPNIKAKPLAAIQILPFLYSFRNATLQYSSDCDIVHAHWSASGIPAIACKKRFKKPVILTLRGSDFSGSNKNLLTRITKRLLTKVDGVTTVNEVLRKKAIGSILSPDACQVIRNGVDIERFGPAHSREILANKPAASADIVILVVGRLTKVKGPDIALKVFEEACRKTNINIHLIFAGDGNMRESLSSTVNSSPVLNGHVSFVGEVENSQISKYYQAANLLLITSRSEGLPNSLLEAMSCGIPTVSTPVGGVPEIITNGTTGYLSDDFSTRAITSTLLCAINNTEQMKQVGLNARDWITSNMSWDIHANKLECLYNKVISQKKQ